MLRFVFTIVFVIFTIRVNTEPTNSTETWKGKWFPENPHNETPKLNETWKGKWFPDNPLVKDKSKKSDLDELFDITKTETNTRESWKGNWFPRKPKTKLNPNIIENTIYVEPDCDDGKKNIKIDFDPEEKRQNYNFVCLDRKSDYEPSYATFPIRKEFTVPPAFKAPSYCLNETIEYEEPLPTFGGHRYLYPQYGEYMYLPPQRWMHNLEYGSVLMLYHPCANKMQVEQLKNTLRACVYRHIISPSLLLTSKRPLALLVWGNSLEMSVVHVPTVVDFIKNFANKGPESGEPNIQKYDAGLVQESRLVTDEKDSELCANIIL